MLEVAKAKHPQRLTRDDVLQLRLALTATPPGSPGLSAAEALRWAAGVELLLDDLNDLETKLAALRWADRLPPQKAGYEAQPLE